MTIRRQIPLSGYEAPSDGPYEDEDDDISPSNGYFGQTSPVPDAILVPNPNSSTAMDKAKEAGEKGKAPPAGPQTMYTPGTSTSATSRRDSGSAYGAYMSRSRDLVNANPEPSLLDDEDDPPPMYSDTPDVLSQASVRPSAPPTVAGFANEAVDDPRHRHYPPGPPNNPGLFPSPNPGGIPPNRAIRQHETHRSISGTFKLYDLLELETASGSISITIDPQPGSLPAVIKLTSLSGSINIKMSSVFSCPTPLRTYQISISTQSGSVSGSVVVGGGGFTAVSTRSGSQRLSFLPIGVGVSSNTTSTLTTESQSGSQNLVVKSPVDNDGAMIALAAKHVVHSSGSVHLSYPAEWEGIVHAKSSGSGSVGAKGTGLQFQRRDSRELYAWRGERPYLQPVEIVGESSGSISFAC